MSGRLSRGAYKELVDQDIEWLMKQRCTLERDHIKMILERAVDYEYPAPISQDILDKLALGDGLTDAELEFAHPWFSKLENELRQLGERFHFAWLPVFNVTRKIADTIRNRDSLQKKYERNSP